MQIQKDRTFTNGSKMLTLKCKIKIGPKWACIEKIELKCAKSAKRYKWTYKMTKNVGKQQNIDKILHNKSK